MTGEAFEAAGGDVCVGVMSPGEMGAAVGRSLLEHGRRVISVIDGRSPDTARRARAAGIGPVASLEALVSQAEVVVSVVPPQAAGDVAECLADAIGRTAATPLVVEANAISPARAQRLADLLTSSGASFVDADLIGGPPGPGRPPTRLYLSGPHAARAAQLLGTPELKAVSLEGPPMAASSLKMAYAAWTKGSAALVLTARALAQALGVEDALLAEWAESQPDLPRQWQTAAERSGRAWRFVAEMEEVASALSSVGLPPEAAEGAADVYRRLTPLKGEPAPPAADVMRLLR